MLAKLLIIIKSVYVYLYLYPALTKFNGLIIHQEIEQGRDAGTSLRQKLPDKSKA